MDLYYYLRAVCIQGSILSLFDWGCTHRFFPYWLRLYVCVFVKDQLFPFWDLSICTFVKDQLLLFWGLTVCTSQISIPSLLGFARLYFAKYQLLPFWLRLCAAPLYLYAIITCSICHSLGPGCTRPRGSGCIQSSHLLSPLCCVGEKVKNRYPNDWATTNVPHIWAGVIPAVSVLLGRDVPGHTPTLMIWNSWKNVLFEEKWN